METGSRMQEAAAFHPRRLHRKVPFCIWALLFVQGILLFGVSAVLVAILATENVDIKVLTPTREVRSATPVEPTVTGALTFDEIFDRSFTPNSFAGEWLAGGDRLVYSSDSRAVISIDPATGSETVFLDSDFISTHAVSDYFMSPDATQVLLACNKDPIWRYSYQANYKILTLSDRSLTSFPSFEQLDKEKLRYASWMSAGSALVFVYGNNLYYQASYNDTAKQLTADGDDIYLFNGLPDWLYEEDVLGSRVASYPSPDDGHLVYGRFNDSDLHFVRYSLYGSPDEAYGGIRELAYPICGDITADGKPGPNSQAELWLVDINDLNRTHQQLQPPEELANQDHYYTRVVWRDSTHVMVTWANRVQNKAYIITYDVTYSPPNQNKHYELLVDNGWIESPWRKPLWMNGSAYLTILPKPEGDTGTWMHLAMVTAPDDGLGNVTFLTTGHSEVLSVLGYDQSNHVIYFLTTNGDARDRHLVRIGTASAIPELQEQKCLTCAVPGCEYVSAYFSGSLEYYVLNCLGPDIPNYSIRSTKDELFVNWLEKNERFTELIATKNLPERQFERVSVYGDYEGWAEVFPTVDGGTPGPLLVYTYGGPHSQLVTKRYPLGGRTRNWLTYLKTTHGVVVSSLDGRGTTGAGDKYMFEMYKRMGTVEVYDQITGASHFKEKNYVDQKKAVAMFGWSYGGQMTSHVIGQDSNVVQCAIAVAPVTTQRLYDTAYTERYMSLATPDDNQAGYNKTDVFPLVENFRNKKYLIAHGTDDDNVHFRHAALLIKALTDAEIPFRTSVFVDENHGIGALHQSRHLFQDLTRFLVDDCWGGEVTSAATRPVATDVTRALLAMAVWMYCWVQLLEI